MTGPRYCCKQNKQSEHSKTYARCHILLSYTLTHQIKSMVIRRGPFPRGSISHGYPQSPQYRAVIVFIQREAQLLLDVKSSLKLFEYK